MEKKNSVTELYRQIGQTFREYGADKVVLLNARNHVEDEGMSLEIAVDGWIEKVQLLQKCGKLWPDIEISILDLNEDENLGLVDEVMEDGILL